MTGYFLRYKDLKERKIVQNRTTLKRWMARKEKPFPSPVRLGLNTVAWRAEDIEKWIQQLR